MVFGTTGLLFLYLGLAAALKTGSRLQTVSLLAKQYPAPIQLASEPAFQAAAQHLGDVLDKRLTQLPYNETTFSIGMFSTSSDDLVYQYHHTSSVVARDQFGTQKVDAESIYRIGSISKLLTVYLFLVCEGDRYFNEPIAKFLPQLEDADWNSLTPDWNEITIGDLASQMGGLARDSGLADLAPSNEATVPVPAGAEPAFPHIPTNEIPVCGYLTPNASFVTCSLEEYIRSAATGSPIFPTAYTAVYSNEAFALIGQALAKITNTSLEALFNESLVVPLGLSSTSYNVPNSITAQDVIPGNPLEAGWNTNLGPYSPCGGYFSSIEDFAKIGRAMLNSTLLPKPLTRRWMKPTSFVENYANGVGRPWEIYRVKVDGYSVELYTKAGDWGVYSTFFALVPTYDFGMALFTAFDPKGEAGGDVRDTLPNLLVDAILPALDKVAKQQAEAKFAGYYTAEGANSSITVGTDDKPGLKLTGWISNGVDLLDKLWAADVPNLDYRILPNELFEGNLVGFTSFYQSATPAPAEGVFYDLLRADWLDVDELNYGNIPIGQFVFELDAAGKAESIQVRALRTILHRKG